MNKAVSSNKKKKQEPEEMVEVHMPINFNPDYTVWCVNGHALPEIVEAMLNKSKDYMEKHGMKEGSFGMEKCPICGGAIKEGKVVKS